MPIKLASAVFVLTNHGAIQLQPGKNAPGARVAEDLGTHLPIGIGRSMASYRAGGNAGISSELELAGEKLLHSPVIHNQHDQIDRLATDLQPKTSAFHAEKRRRTPALWECGNWQRPRP